MAKSFFLFPTIENLGLVDLLTPSSYCFQYERNGNSYDLKNKGEDPNEVVLLDSEGLWTIEDDNLIVSNKFILKGANRLYGPEGIACNTAKLSLGLSWYSHDSNRRDVLEIGEIANSQEEQAISLCYTFEKQTLRKNLNLDIIIYIKKAGNPTEEEKHLANKTGYNLGTLTDTCKVLLEGNGSDFPIFIVKKPGEPLWSLDFKCDSFDCDLLQDKVSINLNELHPSFALIDKNDKKNFNPSILAETLGDALAALIESVRAEDSEFECLDEAKPGSVALAIKFFSEQLHWDLKNPVATSRSIRKYLGEKFSNI